MPELFCTVRNSMGKKIIVPQADTDRLVVRSVRTIVSLSKSTSQSAYGRERNICCCLPKAVEGISELILPIAHTLRLCGICDIVSSNALSLLRWPFAAIIKTVSSRYNLMYCT